MINFTIYKLFNPDLQNMSNNQLLYHWNTYGINENRIFSIDTFFRKYPYFENKLLNNKLETMVNWHLNAINNQKSIKVFVNCGILSHSPGNRLTTRAFDIFLLFFVVFLCSRKNFF